MRSKSRYGPNLLFSISSINSSVKRTAHGTTAPHSVQQKTLGVRWPSVYCGRVRNVAAITVYLITVFAGAALLAPFAWQAVFADWAFLGFLKEHDDFHRYFNRCLMLIAIGGLVVLWRVMKIESWRELGWFPPRTETGHLARGLLLGLTSVTALGAAALLAGVRDWAPAHSVSEWGRHLLNSIGAAAIVGILEETIFRGMLFQLLRRDLAWRWAAVVSAVIFSAVHFLNQRPDINTITWTTGFTALPQFVHPFSEDPYWPAYFVNLFLSGLVLAGAVVRTGSIYLAIGIHAGWILALKTCNFVLTPKSASTFWGHGSTEGGAAWAKTPPLLDGWLATLLLATLAWFMLRPNDVEPKSTAS